MWVAPPINLTAPLFGNVNVNLSVLFAIVSNRFIKMIPSINSSDSNLGRCPKLKSQSSSEVPFCVMRSFAFCARSREIAGSIIRGRASVGRARSDDGTSLSGGGGGTGSSKE